MSSHIALRQHGYTAIIGGSFDPIHNGHLFLAQKLCLDSQIETVAFVPVGNHHFKKDSIVLPFEQRLQLIQQILEPKIQLWLDDASGSGYTSELMRSLQAKFPKKRFAFVIGSDNLTQLHKWHDFQWLKSKVTFCIVPRAGYDLQDLDGLGIEYMIKDIHPPEVSSSMIRRHLLEGKSIHGLVPDAIEALVKQLYEQYQR